MGNRQWAIGNGQYAMSNSQWAKKITCSIHCKEELKNFNAVNDSWDCSLQL